MKTKGRARKAATPKAGPKKARAKTEREQIDHAVDENTIRRPAKKRASKVHTYKYKEVEEAEKNPLEAEHWEPYLREPTELESYREQLPEEQQFGALMFFQMECPHEVEQVIVTFPSMEPTLRYQDIRCPRCHFSQRRKAKTHMLQQEWRKYCPDGFDMFEWEELFTRDKSMWKIIFDEVEYELVKDILGEEAA